LLFVLYVKQRISQKKESIFNLNRNSNPHLKVIFTISRKILPGSLFGADDNFIRIIYSILYGLNRQFSQKKESIFKSQQKFKSPFEVNFHYF